MSDIIDRFLSDFDELDGLYYPTEFKDAIVDLVEYLSNNGHERKLLINKDKCIRILCDSGCSYEDAIEYFEYNVIGSYFNGCPVYASFIEGIDISE